MPRRRIEQIEEDGQTAYRIVRFRRLVDDETSQVAEVILSEDVFTLNQIDNQITRFTNRANRWTNIKNRILQMQTAGDTTTDELE